MRLLLVRHGETEGNLRRELQGAEDPLTERGRRQARELAAHLGGRTGVSAIYTSPYRRACETARAIGDALHMKPVPRAGLAEVDVGDAAGYRFEEWAERFPDEAARFRDDGLGYAWPGGESGHQVAARTSAEADRILGTHRKERGAVIVVSHGGALAWILSHLLKETGDGWPYEHMRLDNCSITEMEVPSGGAEPATFIYRNEIGHLLSDPDAEIAKGQSPVD